MKSSFERVLATCHNNHGNTRLPTISMSAMKIATLPKVISNVISRLGSDEPASVVTTSPPSQPASGGSNTRTRTIARSSTTNHPTAIWPLTDLSAPRCSSARSSTTVLATESARPNTRPAPRLQPQRSATPIPSAVATTICKTAPGTAIRLTARRSFSEKCNPTPNIKRITPISAS